ncbi:MAG TPA: dienelactone hydrolase family protein [Candidatus Limnocylindrales bacterium]|nr:dienelactone hydrolase family protein [Candidatus Limnocylindrales bacterium]
MGETIRIQTAAGDTDTYLAPGRPSPGAPVLLLHTWWGLNETMRDLADRLAGDGFTVMAPDLFDGTVLTTIEDAEAYTTSIEQGDGRPDGLNPDRIMGRVQATLDHLLAHPDVRGDQTGIIALSFGGWYGSHVAAERSDVAAFVSIYSDVYEAPGGAAYLGHFAGNDQFVDSTPVADMEKTLGEGSAAHVYPGTKHWFIESDRPEFDAEATELAYARTVAFLRANLG